jgi:hypothetical protein
MRKKKGINARYFKHLIELPGNLSLAAHLPTIWLIFSERVAQSIPYCWLSKTEISNRIKCYFKISIVKSLISIKTRLILLSKECVMKIVSHMFFSMEILGAIEIKVALYPASATFIFCI